MFEKNCRRITMTVFVVCKLDVHFMFPFSGNMSAVYLPTLTRRHTYIDIDINMNTYIFIFCGSVIFVMWCLCLVATPKSFYPLCVWLCVCVFESALILVDDIYFVWCSLLTTSTFRDKVWSFFFVLQNYLRFA